MGQKVVKLSLECAIIGRAGTFDVSIDDGNRVSALQKAIAEENKNFLKHVDPANLRLFLARKGNAWLSSRSEAAYCLMEGKPHEDIRLMIYGRQMMGQDTLKELFEDNKMEKISSQQIHILVLVPDIATTIEVNESLDEPQELAYYQRLGREIQMNCQDQCSAILDKIDFIYDKGPDPKPFVCVQGSSGMGKTQLAFALGGEGRECPRPWFYWSLAPNVVVNQRVYKNFSSIAKAFNSMVQMDLRDELSEDAVLNCSSEFYTEWKLWTYGFIIELLRYCCREDKGAEMIRVEDETFTVTKCNQKDVRDVLSGMKQDRRVWPFFILDEMTPSGRILEMKKKAAFQRNVFRACGLVVAVMSTDAKISGLVWQAELSRADCHWWMSVVSNFPEYQSIPLGVSGSAKETTWQKVIGLYPVVKNIAEHSRGLFARYFVDAVVDYAMRYAAENETFALADLLDTAFQEVSTNAQVAKMYMSTDEGRDAQLMALSYTNASGKRPDLTIPQKRKIADDADDGSEGRAPKKRRTLPDVGVERMHLHFANLVDEGITDVDVIQGDFLYRATDKGGVWKPICRFPVIEDDVLLYLAVLGGKHFSAYYNYINTVEYSTAAVFRGFRSRSGNRPHVNPNAFSYSEYENMIAHALVCASRRNGVGGIAFNDFFAGLLGEFQDNYSRRSVLMSVLCWGGIPVWKTSSQVRWSHFWRHLMRDGRLTFLKLAVPANSATSVALRTERDWIVIRCSIKMPIHCLFVIARIWAVIR